MQEHIQQLDFLRAFAGETRHGTLTFFDSIPRYVAMRGKEPMQLERTFHWEGKEYQTVLLPRVTAQGKAQYPSVREEVVEAALRHLFIAKRECGSIVPAPEGKARCSLRFSNAHLRGLLAEHGHDYNSVQIDDALRLLATARFELNFRQKNKWRCYRSPSSYIEMVSVSDDSEEPKWIEYGINFNDLATEAFLGMDFSPCAFSTEMRLATMLARWLFRRMHNPANVTEGLFRFSLSEIQREGPMDFGQPKELWQKGVLPALRSLENEGVLERSIHVGRLQGAGWLVDGFCPEGSALVKRTFARRSGRGRPKIRDVEVIVSLGDKAHEAVRLPSDPSLSA
jgi:hypothetical protein